MGSSRIFIGKKLHSVLLAILNLYKESTLFRKKNFFNKKFYFYAEKFQSNRDSVTLIRSLPKSIFEISIIIVLVIYFKLSLSENIDNTILLDKLVLMAIVLYRLYPTYASLQNNVNNIFDYKKCLDELYSYFLKVKFFLIKKKVGKILDKKNKKKITKIDINNVKIFFNKKKSSYQIFKQRKGK